MIIGLGTDIVDVADVARRLERVTFRRAFSVGELAYADSHPKRYAEILAARWAAKEAFGKALGTGLRIGWPLHEIEVVRDSNGRPELRLGPTVAHLLPDGARSHLSLSHVPAWAVATVIIERP